MAAWTRVVAAEVVSSDKHLDTFNNKAKIC